MNIIVATQVIEEGLDIQGCNLVIRFDLSDTVCSFIQSRGRARMKGSHYVLLVRWVCPFVVQGICSILKLVLVDAHWKV